MEKIKIPTIIGVIIIAILAVITGIFSIKYPSSLQSQLAAADKQESLRLQEELRARRDIPRDDLCNTDDFKYMTFGLKKIIYTVKASDNLWNVLLFNLSQQGLARELSKKELSGVLDDVKNKMKKMSPEQLRDIGISSGKPNMIKLGDKIDLLPVLSDVKNDYNKKGKKLLNLQETATFKKNDKFVCWGRLMLLRADPNTFIAFKNYMGADKKSFYFKSQVLQDSDPSSIVFLNESYVRDSRYVYFNGEKITGADPKSFKLLEYSNSDKSKFFYSMLAYSYFKEPDPSETLFPNFANTSIYWAYGDAPYDKKGLMTGINLDEVTFLGNIYYSKDDKNIYAGSNIIKGADAKNFLLISDLYAKDANNVYCAGIKIEGADVSSFTVPNPVSRGKYAKDKNNEYETCRVKKLA